MKTIAWRVSQWNNESVFFDFLPVTEDRYEWYVSEPEGARTRITRLDSSLRKKGDQTKWAEAGVWNADFGSRFFAVSSGDDRYFVSDMGHVYFAPRVAKVAKTGTPLKETWTGKPPVDALIHDVDSKKWYAFTKDEYFEITDPIKPKPHTLAALKGRTAMEALDAATRCGRVIRGLPEPKK